MIRFESDWSSGPLSLGKKLSYLTLMNAIYNNWIFSLSFSDHWCGSTITVVIKRTIKTIFKPFLSGNVWAWGIQLRTQKHTTREWVRAGSETKNKTKNYCEGFSSSKPTMPSPFTTDMESNSQYSSCETLDSHRSSECDEKSEVNGNSHKKTRKVRMHAANNFPLI